MAREYTYYDLQGRRRSESIHLLFPEWRPGEERLAVLSPHDDDALLGAGYAILAAQAEGAEVSVFILCDGRAGYTDPCDRRSVVDTRRKEATEAYGVLGIHRDGIVRFEIPDFSLLSHLAWHPPGGREGIFARLLRRLRERKVTRILIPNGYREHTDHSAAARMGQEIAPQVGDPLLPDLGAPSKVKGCLVYSVWGAFSPAETAFRGIKATGEVEGKVQEAIGRFSSQGEIIEGLIRARRERAVQGGSLEIYLETDPRPPLRYGPYRKIVAEVDEAHET
jgi:LmbE family N-acetylglucosaminyl deacetylase